MNEPLKSTRICAVCGKEFIFHRGAGWLYKRVKDQKTIYFCSWKCQRMVELGQVEIVTKQEISE